MTLDDLDRRIVQMIQTEFPVESRPFAGLAAAVGSTESETLCRIQRLQDLGAIRGIGPVFDLRKLGYTSTLCAARVAGPWVDRVAGMINGFHEITHNYVRDDRFNMWFTVIAPSKERIEAILGAIRSEEGVKEVLSLPAERMFKIRVHFDAAREDG